MGLKERKRILNLKRFDGGLDMSGFEKDKIKGVPIFEPWALSYSLPTINDPKYKQLNNINTNIDNNKNTSGLNLQNGGNVATSAVLFAGATINAFGNNKTSQEILNESGLIQQNAMGVGYNYQQNPDEDKQWSDLRKSNTSNVLATAGAGAALGGAVGSVVPGLGTVVGGVVGGAAGLITGLFGSKHRSNMLKKQINNARLTANARNTYNFSGAASNALEQQYYQNNGDTDSLILYANKGKDLPMYNKGKDANLIKLNYGQNSVTDYSPFVNLNKNKTVFTPNGSTKGGVANSKVGLGESIIDFRNKTATLVDKGKRVGVDDLYANVDNETFIAGNTMLPNGQTPAEMAQPYTIAVEKLNKSKLLTEKNYEKSSLAKNTISYINKKLDENTNLFKLIADIQKRAHIVEDGLNRYNCGKLPRFKEGENPQLVDRWSLNTAHLPAMLGGIALLIDAGKPIYTPSLYRSNHNAGLALKALLQNRPDYSNQINAINNSLRQTLYGIKGLTGAQRMQNAIAATLLAGANKANVYSQYANDMNKYRSDYAQMAATLGHQDATARQEAAAKEWEAYRAAQDARYKMKNTGWANIANALEQTAADRFKINMGEHQLGLYQQILNAQQQEAINNYNIAMANIAAQKDNRATSNYILKGGATV